VAAGQAEPHHILPQTGWVSLHMRAEQDVLQAINLLRRSYEIALKQRGGADALKSDGYSISQGAAPFPPPPASE
jgi:hypothetical protein